MIYSLGLHFKTGERTVDLHVEVGAKARDSGRRFVVKHVLMPAVLRVVELWFNRPQPSGDWP